MPADILLIIHHHESTSNRIADLLIAKGYRLRWCCPRDGDRLPGDGDAYAGVVMFGGAMSANDEATEPYIGEEIRWLEEHLKHGLPFLGICLGAQILAKVLGGQVSRHAGGLAEVGYYPVRSTAAGASLFGEQYHAFQWHQEGIVLNGDVELLATSDTFETQAFRCGPNTYGLQFHPEATREIFERWMVEAPECFEWNGAQTRDQLREGWRRHDRAIASQIDRFLDHWLDAETTSCV